MSESWFSNSLGLLAEADLLFLGLYDYQFMEVQQRISAFVPLARITSIVETLIADIDNGLPANDFEKEYVKLRLQAIRSMAQHLRGFVKELALREPIDGFTSSI